jgi:NADH dehydrogenase
VAGVVAVTGASGRLGELVVAALRRQGRRVRCLVHERDVEGADESVRGDLADGSGLDELVAGAEAVVHLAATTHARTEAGYRRVNLDGTRNLLAAAERAGVQRFVHLSSAAISRAGGAYSRSKADAEVAVTASPLETVILRPSVLIGTGAPKDLDGIVLDACAGRPILIPGSGGYEVRPTPAADVAEAIAAAVSAPAAAGKTYVLGGDALTLREFAVACRDLFGGRSRIVGVPVPLIRAAAVAARVLPLPLYPDQLPRLRAPRPEPTPEAAEELGFRPPPPREALRELAERM